VHSVITEESKQLDFGVRNWCFSIKHTVNNAPHLTDFAKNSIETRDSLCKQDKKPANAGMA
jgi:hypothetical protein